MSWETLKPALSAALLAAASALAGAGGTYLATAPAKPAGPTATMQQAVHQLVLVEGMTGLCLRIERTK